MGLLDGLLSDSEARAGHQDFANRFEQGEAGYSEQEAFEQHEKVAQRATPQEYQQAAMAAFQRMTPQQRQQFRQEINHRMGQHGHQHPGQGGQGHGRGEGQGQGHAPGELAKLVGDLHSQNPGMLGSLMGGGGGMGGSIGKMALGGIAAMAIKQAMH
jgi:hypothetical protein